MTPNDEVERLAADSNASAVTTEPPSHSPTDSPASSGRPGSTNAPSMANGVTPRPDSRSPVRCAQETSIMTSGSVRDAEKPITAVARGGLPSVWLRVRGSDDATRAQDSQARLRRAHRHPSRPAPTEG